MIAAALSALVLAAAPQPWEGAFPASAEAGFILRLDAELVGRPLAFDVSPWGQPFLASGAVVLPVMDRPDRELPPFKLGGAERIDELGFTRDGALLLISGRTLGAATASGFKALATLPGDGFHLASGRPGEAWLWGGQSAYRLARGGKLEHLFKAPAALEALTGEGDRVVFAMQGAILEQQGTAAPRVLAVVGSPLRSLALSPGGGVFYSTDTGVGFLSPEGRRVGLVKGKGARLRVSSGALFLLFADEGLVRCAPVETFEAMARSIAALAQDGGR